LFSGTRPDGLPYPVGHTRIPVARCNNIYTFPVVGLAVTAVRPTRLTDAMMTAAAAVSGAATIRRDPHGTLLPAELSSPTPLQSWRAPSPRPQSPMPSRPDSPMTRSTRPSAAPGGYPATSPLIDISADPLT
jgi:hypothetical protein